MFCLDVIFVTVDWELNINQPINQSINQSVNQSIKQASKQPEILRGSSAQSICVREKCAVRMLKREIRLFRGTERSRISLIKWVIQNTANMFHYFPAGVFLYTESGLGTVENVVSSGHGQSYT